MNNLQAYPLPVEIKERIQNRSLKPKDEEEGTWF